MLEGAKSYIIVLEFLHVLSKYLFVLLMLYTTYHTFLMCLVIWNNWGVPLDF